jgi:hypothetical protein
VFYIVFLDVAILSQCNSDAKRGLAALPWCTVTPPVAPLIAGALISNHIRRSFLPNRNYRYLAAVTDSEMLNGEL